MLYFSDINMVYVNFLKFKGFVVIFFNKFVSLVIKRLGFGVR